MRDVTVEQVAKVLVELSGAVASLMPGALIGSFLTMSALAVERGNRVDYLRGVQLGAVEPVKGSPVAYGDIQMFVASKSDIPPPSKQADARAIIEMIDPEMVTAACGVPAGACANPYSHTITMPNPCAFAAEDGYARVLCHELGHLNGWEHPIHMTDNTRDIARSAIFAIYDLSDSIMRAKQER